MTSDHYFSATPASEDRRRSIEVTLAGRPVEMVTSGGTFSPERLDLGTRVLLDAVPEPPATGTLLDLGCGWGPIAVSAALRAPELDVVAVDVNERSLDLTRTNAQRLGLDRVTVSLPDQVPDSLRFDRIWSNPPIRIGKSALHDLLLTWLPRLADGGEAWLVVSKNLGGDSLHRWMAEALGAGFVVDRHSSAKGYRVLRVKR